MSDVNILDIVLDPAIDKKVFSSLARILDDDTVLSVATRALRTNCERKKISVSQTNLLVRKLIMFMSSKSTTLESEKAFHPLIWWKM